MPAALRYAPLIKELGDSTRALAKELEVYAAATPPAGYAIECEVEGISRAADAAGFDRFHLYGHSAGGACALAYAAAPPGAGPQSGARRAGQRLQPRGPVGAARGPGRHRRAACRREDFHLPAAATGARCRPTVPAGRLPTGVDGEPARGHRRLRRGIVALSASPGAPPRVRPARVLQPREPEPPPLGGHAGSARQHLPGLHPDLYEGVHHLKTSHQREPGPGRVGPAAALEPGRVGTLPAKAKEHDHALRRGQ